MKKLATLFRQIEKPITNDVTLTLLNTMIPIFFHCISSLIGIDRVLRRMFNKGKLIVISFNYGNSQLKNENSVLPVVHSSDW